MEILNLITEMSPGEDPAKLFKECYKDADIRKLKIDFLCILRMYQDASNELNEVKR